MRTILIFSNVALLLFSCGQKTDKSIGLSNNVNQRNETSTKMTEKANLDSLIAKKDNSWLLTLEDQKLSFCCYPVNDFLNDIHSKKLNKKSEVFDNEGEIENYSVLFQNKSYIKLTEINGDTVIICGRIFDNSFFSNDSIKINMDKKEFLGLFFERTPTFSDINTISISEDEMGEFEILFFFKNDRLSEIRFDSFNDWIEKGY